MFRLEIFFLFLTRKHFSRMGTACLLRPYVLLQLPPDVSSGSGAQVLNCTSLNRSPVLSSIAKSHIEGVQDRMGGGGGAPTD